MKTLALIGFLSLISITAQADHARGVRVATVDVPASGGSHYYRLDTCRRGRPGLQSLVLVAQNGRLQVNSVHVNFRDGSSQDFSIGRTLRPGQGTMPLNFFTGSNGACISSIEIDGASLEYRRGGYTSVLVLGKAMYAGRGSDDGRGGGRGPGGYPGDSTSPDDGYPDAGDFPSDPDDSPYPDDGFDDGGWGKIGHR